MPASEPFPVRGGHRSIPSGTRLQFVDSRFGIGRRKTSRNSCSIWRCISATWDLKTLTGTSPTPPNCSKLLRCCLQNNMVKGDQTDDLVWTGRAFATDLLHGLSGCTKAGEP